MTSNSYNYSTVRKCADCGNRVVTRAQRSGAFDSLLSLVNVYPYRCHHHTCSGRFYRFGKE